MMLHQLDHNILVEFSKAIIYPARTFKGKGRIREASIKGIGVSSMILKTSDV